MCAYVRVTLYFKKKKRDKKILKILLRMLTSSPFPCLSADRCLVQAQNAQGERDGTFDRSTSFCSLVATLCMESLFDFTKHPHGINVSYTGI